jgi:mono/diheme cytochrome c family protein
MRLMKHGLTGVVGLAVAVLAIPARGQDAVHGAMLASQWCSNCHAVANRGTDMVPTLQAIAQLPGRDAAYLRTFLTSPHAPMPRFDLSRPDIADLASYIAGLRQD